MIEDRPTVPVLCRFAPSPNGLLHLGHAWSAIRNAAVAAERGGRVLLRLENIDEARCRPDFEHAILRDLGWLGLDYPDPVRRQSEHGGLYEAALSRLGARDLLYPCFCTRGDIASALRGRPDWPRDPDGAPLYPGTCRRLTGAERDARLAAGHPHALRLKTDQALLAAGDPPLFWTDYGEGWAGHPVEACPAAWGDPVLRRKDIPASYHVAVVVDDAAQGITDVVRGRDLYAATALHRLLQVLLGLPEPRYHHHRLVLDRDGEKLAKSRDAEPLAALRDRGTTPGAVRALIAARLEATP